MPENTQRIAVVASSLTNVEGDYHAYYTEGQLNARQRVLAKLKDDIVPEVFYDASERRNAPRCHPATRRHTLDEIMSWIKESDNLNRIMWLSGPLASGKSAITQTLAEQCAALGIPVASFFFSRSSSKRSKKKLLIPTLIYQLVYCIPDISVHIETAIQDDPAIFSRSISSQIRILLIEPLRQVTTLLVSETYEGVPRHRHIALILDALDECGGEKTQGYIITEFFRSTLSATPLGIRILISSRPVLEIREAFRLEFPNPQMSVYSLADVQDPTDIKILLYSRFQELRSRHPLKSHIPPNWPTSTDISRLTENASGQFIYASIIMDFISCSHHHPQERLCLVLDASSTSDPNLFESLDGLFHQSLSAIDCDSLARALDILSYIILHSEAYSEPQFISNTLTCERIECLMGYKEGDVQLALIDLHSLVYIPEHGGSIRLHHSTFSDYLFTQSRSGPFHIQRRRAHASISEHFIQHASRSAPDIVPDLIYSIFFHCRNSELTEALVNLLRHFNFFDQVILLIERNSCVFPNPFLPAELDHFFRWLDFEGRILDHENSLLRYHLECFHAWVHRSICLCSPDIRQEVSAAIAICPLYNSKDIFGIIEDVNSASLSFSRGHIPSLFAQSSYLATAAAQCVFGSSGLYSFDDNGYTALARTMVDSLYSCRSQAPLIMASISSFEYTRSTTAREVLTYVLPKAAPHPHLGLLLLDNAVYFTSTELYKYGGGGPTEGDMDIKNRLIELARESLKYIETCQIAYRQHTHVVDYEFCAICESNLRKVPEARKNIDSGRRERIIAQINQRLGASLVHKKRTRPKNTRRATNDR